MMAVLSGSLAPVRQSLHLSRVPHRNKEPATPNERTANKPREQYRLRTRLIHRSFATGRWDYDQHVVPPQSSSATYRLSSVTAGAQGFVEFATPESRRAPIVRLAEAGGADGELAEKRDAGGGIFAAAAKGAAGGLSGAGKLRAARTGAPSDDHAGWVLRARPHAVF